MTQTQIEIRLHDAAAIRERMDAWEQFAACWQPMPLGRHPGWLDVLARGMDHTPYCVESSIGGEVVGLLPLAFVRSLLFGRFLVSLPYLNTAGVLTHDDAAARAMVDGAVELADRLDVRYLELRHEQRLDHRRLDRASTGKVHMRLALPDTADTLWSELSSKVRNQVRKGEKERLSVHWGGGDLLAEFYGVLARNMRDLGTPVFGRQLFAEILGRFPGRAELCVVRHEDRPVAGGILVHGRGVSEVLSAGSLRPYNWTNANMRMYWHLLCRSIERGQRLFDFGRSTPGGNTFRFKRQWGAEPKPSVWQYYLRKGSVDDMRPDNQRYRRKIAVWRRLPVILTRAIGPMIVRGIP